MTFREKFLCPLRNHDAESTNPIDDMMIHCRTDCGWFNKEEEECSMITLAQNVKYLRQTFEEIHQILEEQNR